MMSYKDKVEVAMAINLPTSEAIDWLKDHVSKRELKWFVEDDSAKHKIINVCYYKRNDLRLNLALAKYGTHLPTLRKLFRSPFHTLRLAVLTNPLIGPSMFLSEGILTRDDVFSIVTNLPKTASELCAVFENPGLNRDFAAEVIRKEKEYTELGDDNLLWIVAALRNNPIIAEIRDDTWMDGFAEHMHSQLPLGLLRLSAHVPVQKDWAYILTEIFQKTNAPFVPDEISPALLDRWRLEEGEEKDNETPTSSIFWFRYEFARLLFENHRSEDKKTITLEHPDRAVRLAVYTKIRPGDLFGWETQTEEFHYPSFKYDDEDDLTLPQKTVVEICKKYFQKDGNDFIEHLIRNESFWRRKEERELLNTLAWHLAEDKHSDMMTPNLLRVREKDMFETHPEYFKDEEIRVIEREEEKDIAPAQDLSVVKRLESIEEMLRDLKEDTIRDSQHLEPDRHREMLSELQDLRIELERSREENLNNLSKLSRDGTWVATWIVIILILIAIFK